MEHVLPYEVVDETEISMTTLRVSGFAYLQRDDSGLRCLQNNDG
jgi:hypothetical protein